MNGDSDSVNDFSNNKKVMHNGQTNVNHEEQHDLEALSQNLRGILMPSSSLHNEESIVLEQRNELLEKSISSAEEDFRCTNITPPPDPDTDEVHAIQPIVMPSNAVLLEQQKDLLDESLDSADEDFYCPNMTPPKSTNGMESELEMVNDNINIETMLNHQIELLQSDVSSADEDFRCADRTPTPLSLCGDEEKAEPNPNYEINYDEKWGVEENNKSAEELENGSVSSDYQQPSETNKGTNSRRESKSSTSSFHSTHSLTVKTQTNAENGTENQISTELDVSKVIAKIDKLTLQKIGPFQPAVDGGGLSSTIFNKKYSRSEFINIKKSRNQDEWMVYLCVNHGKKWPIEEVPFELDSELRGPFHKQLRVRREREALDRRNAFEGRNQNMEQAVNCVPLRYGEFSNRDIVENDNSILENPKKKNKKKPKTQKMDGSFGAIQRPVICGVTAAASEHKLFYDIHQSFTDQQISVWMNYLSSINSRINELTESA